MFVTVKPGSGYSNTVLADGKSFYSHRRAKSEVFVLCIQLDCVWLVEKGIRISVYRVTIAIVIVFYAK